MNSLDILYFISSLRGGGAENHLLDLCRFMIRRGNRATVCTLSDGREKLAGEFIDAGARIVPLSLRSLARLALPGVRDSLRALLERSSPGIIHAHLYHAEITAAAAAARSRAPLLVTRHSAGLEFNGTRRLVSSIARRRVDAVIAVSRGAAEEAGRGGFPESSVYLIPNGVDTSRFAPADPGTRSSGRKALSKEFFEGAKEDGILIAGMLGSLKRVKDPGIFLEQAAAFAGEGGSGGDLRALFIGDGPLREVLERSSPPGLAGFTGYVDRPEDYLPLLDIFVMPSLSEGVPLALLQAMSCGLPCLASDVGDVCEVLGGSGLLFRPGDRSGLLDGLRSLASDPSLRSEKGRGARERILGSYDLETWGGRTLELYRSLLARQ